MEQDVLLVFVAIVLFVFGFKFQRDGQYKKAIWLLVLGALFLRVYISLDNFPHAWDERYHALVAKNLLNNPWVPKLYAQPIIEYNYRYWTENEIWLHKPPVTLWSIALSLKVFGITPFAVRIPSILLSTLCVYLVYYLGKEIWNKRTGFLAAFLFAINGLILELVSGRITTDHVDIHFLFFILLSVVLAHYQAKHKGYIPLILLGLSLSLALLTKWLPALVVLPVYGVMFLAYNPGKWLRLTTNLLVLGILCCLLVYPWHYYIHTNFPVEAGWEASYNLKHLNQVIEKHEGGVLYFFHKIRINYGELIYLPIGYFIWKLKKFFSLKVALLLWFLIPFLVFSSVQTKMQGYLVMASPALFLITAWFFYEVKENWLKYKGLKLTLLILLIVLPVRYSIERLKPFESSTRHRDWVSKIENFAQNCPNKTVLFNYPYAIETMFLTEITAYVTLPSEDVLDQLQQDGFRVVISDEGAYPIEDSIKKKYEIVHF